MKLYIIIKEKSKTVWEYFKDSWEGTDGKFSYRRFSQYVFLVCMIKCGFKPPTNEWEFKVFIVFASLYALLASILTVQQLIELLNVKIPITNGQVKEVSTTVSDTAITDTAIPS